MRSESEESRANHVRPYDVPFQMIRRQFAWQAMKKRISKMRCVFSGIEYIRKYRGGQVLFFPHQSAVFCVDFLHLAGVNRFQKAHVQGHTSLIISLVHIGIRHVSGAIEQIVQVFLILFHLPGQTVRRADVAGARAIQNILIAHRHHIAEYPWHRVRRFPGKGHAPRRKLHGHGRVFAGLGVCESEFVCHSLGFWF